MEDVPEAQNKVYSMPHVFFFFLLSLTAVPGSVYGGLKQAPVAIRICRQTTRQTTMFVQPYVQSFIYKCVNY